VKTILVKMILILLIEFIASELDGEFSNKKINNLRQKIYTYLNLRKIEFVKFNIYQKK
jgi:hypothetical protein